MLCYGGGFAIVTTLITLLEQIVCPYGYSDVKKQCYCCVVSSISLFQTFAGLCGALMFGIGLVGAGLAAIIVDKTKKFEEVAKIGLTLSTVALCAFFVVCKFLSKVTLFCTSTNDFQVSRMPDHQIVLAVLISLVGFFGFAITPVCLELGVECTYPAAEATSTGFIIICG
jgi:FLVCR family MFS transporter 7